MKRNGYGQGDISTELRYKAEGYDSEIVADVQEKKYKREELERVFEKAGKELEILVLGENKSIEEIRSDLNLTETVPGTGIHVSWEISNYDRINILGEIREDGLTEVGETVELTAIMSYGEEQKIHRFSVRVFPQKKTVKKNLRQQ